MLFVRDFIKVIIVDGILSVAPQQQDFWWLIEKSPIPVQSGGKSRTVAE